MGNRGKASISRMGPWFLSCESSISEVDSLCGARGESGESDAARRIKTEFLAQCGRPFGLLHVSFAPNTWNVDCNSLFLGGIGENQQPDSLSMI